MRMIKMGENNCGMCGCNLFIARKDGVECQVCGNVIKDELAPQILLSSLMDAKFELLSLVSTVESNRIRMRTVNESCVIAFDFYYNDFNGMLGIKNCELLGVELKNDAVTTSADIGLMCVVWNNEHVWKPIVETLHEGALLGDIVMTRGPYRDNVKSKWGRS